MLQEHAAQLLMGFSAGGTGGHLLQAFRREKHEKKCSQVDSIIDL